MLPDVDVAKVAEQLFWAAFTNTGQICIATKRMYVHKDVYEPLKQAIVDFSKTVKMGDYELRTGRGTRTDPEQAAVSAGSRPDRRPPTSRSIRFLVGGEAQEGAGYFIPISILDNPPENSRIVQEEQFGPVLPLLKVDSIDEVAVSRANASDYGLGGSVWSSDPEAALAVGQRLQTGTVWINETQYITPLAGFAGHKQSGVGVENGMEGLLEYTNTQTIVVNKT